jgi:hypothetical protein
MKKKSTVKLALSRQTIHHLKGGITPKGGGGNDQTEAPECPTGRSLCPVISCGVYTGCENYPVPVEV